MQLFAEASFLLRRPTRREENSILHSSTPTSSRLGSQLITSSSDLSRWSSRCTTSQKTGPSLEIPTYSYASEGEESSTSSEVNWREDWSWRAVAMFRDDSVLTNPNYHLSAEQSTCHERNHTHKINHKRITTRNCSDEYHERTNRTRQSSPLRQPTAIQTERERYLWPNHQSTPRHLPMGTHQRLHHGTTLLVSYGTAPSSSSGRAEILWEGRSRRLGSCLRQAHRTSRPNSIGTRSQGKRLGRCLPTISKNGDKAQHLMYESPLPPFLLLLSFSRHVWSPVRHAVFLFSFHAVDPNENTQPGFHTILNNSYS